MDDNSSVEMPLLTFNSLQNLRLGEIKAKKLQELPELFYEATEEFFSNKKKEIERIKSEPDKLRKEKQILKKSQELLESIIEHRCRKIANLAICEELFGEETISKDNILEKEKEYFESIKKATKKIKKINV